MKKLLSLLLSLLLALSAASVTAFAEGAPAEDTQEVIDVDDLGAATASLSDSYAVVDGDETLLEVEQIKAPGVTAALNDTATSSYYTAEFMIPETNDKVFLTGLTQDNVSEITQAIIESYTEGKDFSLSNLGFIDTEKTWAEDGDDNLCWAAASSNILTYTGWAAKAGFNSTDDLFETFIDSFTNAGGNVFYGVGWFFDGIAGQGASQPTAGTGGYLPQYYYGELVENFDLDTTGAAGLKIAYDRLHDGYGVALSVDIYRGATNEGGHAITCWGFVTDIRYPDTNKLHYKSVFVTDSDSDKLSVQGDMDRRDADDVMWLFALEPVEQGALDTYTFNITDQQVAVLTETSVLLPYSADLPYETASDATLDPANTTDICIDPFYLTDDSSVEQSKTVFSPDDTIYFQAYMANISDVTYYGGLQLKITVTDESGSTIYTRPFNYSATTDIEPSSGAAFGMTSIGKKLPVGDYTITAEFNASHSVAEAYYYNNKKSVSLKVRDSYLLGDVDNDDSVASIDATIIQRNIAGLDKTLDANAVVRGDINESGELDIIDATIIQRYLAKQEILYSIDVTRFYD